MSLKKLDAPRSRPTVRLDSAVAALQTDVATLAGVDVALDGRVDALEIAPPTHAASHLVGGSDPLTRWAGSYQSFTQAGTSPWECWYGAGLVSSSATGTASLGTGVLYAIPIVAPDRGGTIDRIGLEITTLAALGSARVGVWSPTSAANMYPSALVIDAGTFATTAVGMFAATLSQALSPGALYWLGVEVNVVPGVRVANNQLHNALGYPPTGGTAPYWGCVAVRAFGAFGAFPAGATLQTGAPRPVIFYRYSL